MGLSLPLKKIKKKDLFWFFVFAFVFVLSLDVWNWNQTALILFGFPFWIIRLILLTMFLTPLFFVFVNSMWREQ